MKIFEIIYNDDEKQWVAANTNIDALREVLSIESTDLDLMQEINELPEDKWDEYTVTNNEYDETDKEDWQSMTFREFMNQSPHAQLISATFYE
jgi:hypothetical protein